MSLSVEVNDCHLIGIEEHSLMLGNLSEVAMDTSFEPLLDSQEAARLLPARNSTRAAYQSLLRLKAALSVGERKWSKCVGNSR
jgi:hypothetical protein